MYWKIEASGAGYHYISLTSFAQEKEAANISPGRGQDGYQKLQISRDITGIYLLVLTEFIISTKMILKERWL